MRIFSARSPSAEQKSCIRNNHQTSQPLTAENSRTFRVATTTAAILLIFSSAGFGAVFALTQARHHGAELIAFAVAMALGLEFAKPFAVESVFACVRRLHVGRALAMVVLATVAIGYSLTAELSLMAQTRGAGIAERSRAVEVVTAAREAVAAAERARTVECEKRGPNCRAREADERTARAQLAQALATTPAVRAPDPGAAALSNYLAIFGLTVPAGLLSDLLVGVGVLALEAGSALSIVLVRSVQSGPVRKIHTTNSGAFSDASKNLSNSTIVDTPNTNIIDNPEPAERDRPRRRKAARAKEAAQRAIVDTLQTNGGQAPRASVRRLGKMLSIRKSTVHNALVGLIAAGVVARIGSDLILRT